VNLNAKIKKLEREIEALWSALGGRPQDPKAPEVAHKPAALPEVAEIGAQSAPKRRGRPPKVTNGN